MFGETIANDLNPFPDGTENPSVGEAAEPAVKTASMISFNRALQYAASRENFLGGTGLLYPFKSEVFRGMLESAGRLGERAPEIAVGYATADALGTTLVSAYKNACH